MPHRTIDSLIRRIAEDRLPAAREEYRVEDFRTLTPRDFLGLSKPTVSIDAKGQLTNVTMAVAILANARRNHKEILDGFLNHYNLNAGLYGTERNPRGIFHRLPANILTERIIRAGIFLLLGVKQEIRYNVLGDDGRFSYYLSEAYKETEYAVRRDRFLFPLTHPDQFPEVKRVLDKIESLNLGINPEKIFISDKIPPVFPWVTTRAGRPPLLLAETLSILAMALSSQMTMSEISRKSKINYSFLINYLSSTAKRSPFTTPILRLVKERLKRGW